MKRFILSLLFIPCIGCLSWITREASSILCYIGHRRFLYRKKIMSFRNTLFRLEKHWQKVKSRLKELNDVQSQEAELGGYYHPDPAKVARALVQVLH